LKNITRKTANTVAKKVERKKASNGIKLIIIKLQKQLKAANDVADNVESKLIYQTGHSQHKACSTYSQYLNKFGDQEVKSLYLRDLMFL
jgi:hypothetical protein